MILEHLDAIVAWVWVGGMVAGIATFCFGVWLEHPTAEEKRQKAERRAREKEEADRAFLASGLEP